jgi:hypothetical protein
MTPFTLDADGVVSAGFDDTEVELLTMLSGQLIGVLDELGAPSDDDPLPGLVVGGSSAVSDDPVLARLLPNAYADTSLAQEFRELTERGLAGRKIANARTVMATVAAETRLDPAASLAWLRSLTDIRLAIAARLGIETDETEIEESEESDAMLAVYDWLGGVQDSLVQALDA